MNNKDTKTWCQHCGKSTPEGGNECGVCQSILDSYGVEKMEETTELEEYQEFVKGMTWDSTKEYGIYWTMIAIQSELGELAQIVEKVIRKKNGIWDESDKSKMKDELGDVMWNVAKIANDMGFSLDEVIEDNISKLNARAYASKNT